MDNNEKKETEREREFKGREWLGAGKSDESKLTFRKYIRSESIIRDRRRRK